MTQHVHAERSEALMGLLGGPLTWFACFLLLYFIVGTGCELAPDESINGVNTVRLIALSICLVAGILIAWLGFASFRKWRNTSRTLIDSHELVQRRRVELLHFSGLVLSLLSQVGVIWLAVTLLMNPIC